jgi:Tfp pilus assembly protein PilF
MSTLIARSTTALALACLLGLAVCASGCNSTSAWSRNQIGKRYYNTGDYTAARRSFEQALMNDPWNPDYAFNVAAAMQKQGDALAAERMYQHSLTLNPSHQPSYHALAGLLHDQGRTGEAQELIGAWVETQPYTPESHIEMAWMQQELGDMAAAEMSLQEALRRNPRHPRAMAQLGQVYERTGRRPEAAAMYNRSLAYRRNQPQVASRLGAMQTANPMSPSLMMAQQMPQYDPLYGSHPFAQAPMTATTPGYTAFMPTAPLAAQPVNPWMTGTAVAPMVSPMTAGATPVMTTTPMDMQFATTQPVQVPGLTAAQPMAGGQMVAGPMLAPTTGVPTITPTAQYGPAGSFTSPMGTTIPGYTPQPVQLGTPVPISQNPAAVVPSISAVVPVVPAF